MERVSVLCLFLLLCSLSGAELQDKEIIEQRKVSPENGTVPEQPQPQPCPSDLHAVLRDMSVKLAENRLMIQQLQTLNQEQNAKLAKYEVGIQQLQTLNQEQASKLKQLERQVETQQQAQATEVDTLRHQQQEQAANLKGLETQVDTQQQVGQVAFSASLLASGSGFVEPINAHTTLVFKHVVSNIGNAYNPHTGFFTAPVRGAYHFEFFIAVGKGSHPSAVVLMKNGEHIFMAHEHQTGQYGSSGNGATLLLEAGDVVSLQLWAHYKVYDDENHRTTFSGHLLFPFPLITHS